MIVEMFCFVITGIERKRSLSATITLILRTKRLRLRVDSGFQHHINLMHILYTNKYQYTSIILVIKLKRGFPIGSFLQHYQGIDEHSKGTFPSPI